MPPGAPECSCPPWRSRSSAAKRIWRYRSASSPERSRSSSTAPRKGVWAVHRGQVDAQAAPAEPQARQGCLRLVQTPVGRLQLCEVGGDGGRKLLPKRASGQVAGVARQRQERSHAGGLGRGQVHQDLRVGHGVGDRSAVEKSRGHGGSGRRLAEHGAPLLRAAQQKARGLSAATSSVSSSRSHGAGGSQVLARQAGELPNGSIRVAGGRRVWGEGRGGVRIGGSLMRRLAAGGRATRPVRAGVVKRPTPANGGSCQQKVKKRRDRHYLFRHGRPRETEQKFQIALGIFLVTFGVRNGRIRRRASSAGSAHGQNTGGLGVAEFHGPAHTSTRQNQDLHIN